jgi:hypothetical protein
MIGANPGAGPSADGLRSGAGETKRRPGPGEGGGSEGPFEMQDMADQDQAELRMMAARLRQEHEDYDTAINAMIATGCEQLRVQRMKKKKLAIKDKLNQIENQIIPDIIA